MKLHHLIVAGLSLGLHAAAMAQPLLLKTHLAAANNFGITSTLIEGEKEAILVNAQFTRSEALRVAADILDSGKHLTTIFISYGDPDYYFGLQVLKQYFPAAQIIATPETVKHIQDTQALKLKYWGQLYGNNAPTATIVPQRFSGKSLSLDGKTIEIMGQGERTFLWIPELKAVVGGNLVSSGIHVWTADTPTAQERQKLQQGLAQISALQPKIVIPAHMAAGAATGMAAVNFTQSYLKHYERAVNASHNAAQLSQAMQQRYPAFKATATLDLGAKVVKGEMQWP
jgi:glyoxylase-like metal-dependent hydrolase (beta-lactamase superfamily II)